MIQKTAQHRLRFILILGTLSATGPLSIDFYLPALPQMMRQFNTGTSTMQLSITACLIGLAAGQLIAGPLSDRYGRKRPLFVGFLAFASASFLIAFTQSVPVLISLRFFQGLAGASGQVIARAVARDLFSGQALTHFYAILNAVNGLFPILAPIGGGLLIQFVPWQGVFILLGFIGVLLCGLIIMGIPETLPIQNRQTGALFETYRSFNRLIKQKNFVAYVLVTGVIYGGLFSYIAASTFVYQQHFYLSAQLFSVIYAINGLGIVIGSALPGRLTAINAQSLTKVGLRVNLTTSLVLLVGSTYQFPLALVATLIFIIVMTTGLLLTVTTALIMGLTNQNAGGASALIGLSQNAFGGSAAPLVGLLGGASYASMAVLIFLFNFVAIGLMTIRLRPIN